jgi:hypothetical protein
LFSGRDVAADDIENEIDFAEVFQGVVIEVEELLCAEVERPLTGGSAPGADDIRAGLTCELARSNSVLEEIKRLKSAALLRIRGLFSPVNNPCVT